MQTLLSIIQDIKIKKQLHLNNLYNFIKENNESYSDNTSELVISKYSRRKKRMEYNIKEFDDANTTCLRINVRAQYREKIRTLLFRGFMFLGTFIDNDILGVDTSFAFASKYRSKDIEIKPYCKNTNLKNPNDVAELSNHLATAIYETHSKEILKGLEDQFSIDTLFEIKTKEPIIDIEGNIVKIIDILYNVNSITNVELPSITFEIYGSNGSVVDTDTKEFTNIVLSEGVLRNIDTNFENIKNIIKDAYFIKDLEFKMGASKVFVITISESIDMLIGEFEFIKRLLGQYKNSDKAKGVSFKVALKEPITDINNERITEIVFKGKKASTVEYYTGYRNKKLTTIK